jgi:hypothetical protein
LKRIREIPLEERGFPPLLSFRLPFMLEKMKLI